jgi:hypothetical protein
MQRPLAGVGLTEEMPGSRVVVSFELAELLLDPSPMRLVKFFIPPQSCKR